MRSLLDINVAIALLDADHDFHHRAHEWWGAAAPDGWATCPLTENGVVRIMANPAYNPRRALLPKTVIQLVSTFKESTDHAFWADSVSFLDPSLVDPAQVLGPRQITDLYLLALASSHEGCFVTFDESVHAGAVKNARKENLQVI
jgi:uncharacterized protein